MMELEDVEMFGSGNDTYIDNGTFSGIYENCPNDDNVGIIVMQIFYASVCIVGFLGNTLVIYVTLRYSQKEKVTKSYILILAIVDGCLLMGIPFLIVTMSLRSWPFGSFMCKAYMSATGMNQFMSSIFVCIMSADRYIAVCHPIAAPRLRTPFVSRVVCAVAWIASALVTMPILMYTTVIKTENGLSCNIVWPEKEFNESQTSFTLYGFALGFAIPLTLIFVFYCLVTRKLKTIGPKNKSKEKKRSHRKVTILMWTGTAVYVICWLPYWAFQLVLIYFPPTECASLITKIVFLVAALLSYCNSAANPVMYTFLTDDFKKSIFKACPCVPRKYINLRERSPRETGGNADRAQSRTLAEVRGLSDQVDGPGESRSRASTVITSQTVVVIEALHMDMRPSTLTPLIAPDGHTETLV